MTSQETQQGIVSYFSIGLVRVILIVGLLVLLYNTIWLPAIFLLLVVVTLEGASWWSKAGLRNLVVERQVTVLRFFPGEMTKLTFKIRNNKRLPSIIGWQQILPAGLTVKETETIEEKAIMLMGRQNYCLTYDLQVIKRGVWQIPDLHLFSRDGLGLFEQARIIKDRKLLIVYPRLVPLEKLAIKVSDLIGENNVQRPFLPDPIRLVSLREYTDDTPARLIHWKASMGKDQLYAKVLEPSGDYKIYILVDVEYFYQDNDEEKYEKALSVAATMITWAQERNIPFGVLANGRQTGMEGPLSLPIGNGMNHLLIALERLARLEFSPLGDINDFLRLESKAIPPGTSYISIGGHFKDLPNLLQYDLSFD
ncbi:DUF58 domain-containing protein [Desulfotomaculum sp. 1211_IL3151]|uniref:DUF58 domain-containing protein n=1 Tax=Desulfotomaculum sp. 1211_IL3151 TaxID=3084055 RepID=UPI002FD87C4B